MKKIKTGNKHTDKLYEAVRDYIEANKGTVVVIGGIAIMQEPHDSEYKYSLLVRIVGKKPNFNPPKK